MQLLVYAHYLGESQSPHIGCTFNDVDEFQDLQKDVYHLVPCAPTANYPSSTSVGTNMDGGCSVEEDFFLRIKEAGFITAPSPRLSA